MNAENCRYLQDNRGLPSLSADTPLFRCEALKNPLTAAVKPAVGSVPLTAPDCPFGESVDAHCRVIDLNTFEQFDKLRTKEAQVLYPEIHLDGIDLSILQDPHWVEKIRKGKDFEHWEIESAKRAQRNLSLLDPNARYVPQVITKKDPEGRVRKIVDNRVAQTIFPEVAQMALFIRAVKQGEIEEFDPTLKNATAGELTQAFSIIISTMERPENKGKALTLKQIFEMVESHVSKMRQVDSSASKNT